MRKYLFSFLILLGGSLQALSQASSEAKAATSFFDDPLLPFYILVAVLFFVALLVLLVALYMLQVVNLMTQQAAKERAEKLGIPYKPEPSFWERLWEKSNDLVPIEREGEILLDHNYDGIRELDNHLPPWWKGLFYGTIVFSVVYILFYHVLDTMPLQKQEYENEVAMANAQLQKLKASSPLASIDESNVEATTDVQALVEGKQTFMNTCASCHRKDGGGDIGPNLTDEFWLHGGSIKDIFKTVRHGIPATNMIAWEAVMSPEKMKNVSSYIITIMGSNPPNAKKPQGTLFKSEPSEQKKDSVKTQAGL